MSDQHLLHFSFSPVQSFVAQARRTRDLWAGSYLLSWLAGQAMKAVIDNGGTILLPDIQNDPLFQQIRAPQPIPRDDQAAYLGSLPNRFTAQIPVGMDGQMCEDAIQAGWHRVTDGVFTIIKNQVPSDNAAIWERQTKNFWECAWVIGKKSYLLDQRKNIHLHRPADEAGEKCTLCGERQELSGNKYHNRKEIQAWWRKLQESVPEQYLHGLDLREKERLCAVCLTKRLFPHITKQALGWEVPEFYPSTAYISAVDWIIRILDTAAETTKSAKEIKDKASRLLDAALAPKVKHAEKRTWNRIKEIADRVVFLPELKNFLYVDGSIFFQDSLRQDMELFEDDGERKNVLKALKALQQEMGVCNHESGKASPFYALLLMDGDNMGRLIDCRTDDEREKISSSLAQFTRQVPDIVHDNNGMLLYAGGDDVFAILPVSSALECARLCRFAYQCAFRDQAPFVSQSRASISAAIQYAHMNTPLGVVVRDAHRLLVDIAKNRTGRDALACRVWKRGGPILTWSQPWQAIDDGLLIGQVQKGFTDDTNDPDRFSSKFFYKLRDLFKLVNPGGCITDKEDIKDLLVAEYLANREHDWPGDMSQTDKLDKAADRVTKLLRLCREQRRNLTDTNEEQLSPTGGYSDAGALLVRFLTRKEV